AAQKAKLAKQLAAAAAKRRAAAAKRRKQQAARRAAAARRHYCAEIEHGQHYGLTESQVRYYCGQPSHKQHIEGPGLTTDYWMYGDFGYGTVYQLVFNNGSLQSANSYS